MTMCVCRADDENNYQMKVKSGDFLPLCCVDRRKLCVFIVFAILPQSLVVVSFVDQKTNRCEHFPTYF